MNRCASAAAASVVPSDYEPVPPTLRLLLVDDDEDDAQLVADLLEDTRAFELEWCQTISAALARLRTSTFDACLLDYRIGAQTGLELLASRGEFHADLPMIMLTGDGSREIDLAAMRAGASDFLAKDQLTTLTLDKSIRYAVEQERRRQELKRLTRRDALTGLHNRFSINERLEAATERAVRLDQRVVVALLDLDGFKAVNDRNGHAAGDELLQGVAQRLIRAVRSQDHVGRLGGDEFVVILEDIADLDELAPIARRLAASVDAASLVSASVGIAVFPEAVSDADELLAAADEAMYEAKRNGRGRLHFFGDEAASEMPPDATLFGTVLEEGEVVPFLQPQFDMNTSRLVGVEAFARWQRKHERIGAPQEFVPALERSGDVIELDLHILSTVVDWQTKFRGMTRRVSVNFSAISLANTDFIERAIGLLPENPSLLEVEVPSLPEAHHDQILEHLLVLREHDVRLSLAAFGAGHACLGRLRALPVQAVKLDSALFAGVADAPRDAAFVRGIVRMAKELDVKVIAEGIENEAQHEALRILGVDVGQGYWFARPMTPSVASAFLEPLVTEVI
nr:uncharacterized signaling protein PA1727-like [Nerophis lumbriciformis]